MCAGWSADTRPISTCAETRTTNNGAAMGESVPSSAHDHPPSKEEICAAYMAVIRERALSILSRLGPKRIKIVRYKDLPGVLARRCVNP